MSFNEDFSVDIIIPVRSREEYDICERLEMRKSYNLPSGFSFLIVDFGSDPDEAKKNKKLCEKNNFKYYFMDEQHSLWNASKARNFALLKSTADFVIFEDVDLISHVDFYHQIKKQILSLLINRNWPFFVVPVAYLKEEGSKDIVSPLDHNVYDDFVTEIFNAEESNLIDFYAPASSYLICSRENAIFVGGYDEAYQGWGFEDSDFWLKLLRDLDIEKPRDFFRLDTRPYSNQVQWRGWRALFRIFADLCAQKGIYSFHKWHPIAEHRSKFIRERNHKIFLKNTEYYLNEKYSLIPLWSNEKPSHLFLGKNPHSFTKEVFSFFNNPILIEEKDFSLIEIDEIIHKYNIESVIFNNPYGNPKRLAIYQAFKERNIDCFVVERGALPWSVYIDNGGFCAESLSYKDYEIYGDFSEENRLKTIDYINELHTTGASLEPQSTLVGGKNLRRSLFGDSENIKILFVALQSPSDTTTNFFCGNVQNYDNFLGEISMLPAMLEGSQWKIIYKNHPLTIDKCVFDGAINVDDYHIGDILEACDAVTLINSGVGVLSIAYQKPVYHFGQAFYSNSKLNRQVDDARNLVDLLLNEKFLPINEDCLRFISFLINDFYSFASWTREERSHTQKAKLSISKNIRYNTVRVWRNGKNFEKKFDTSPFIGNLKSSILFDRYRLDDYIEREQRKNDKVKDKVPAVNKSVNNNHKVVGESKVIESKIDESKIRSMEAIDKVIKDENKIFRNNYKRKVNKLIKKPDEFFLDFFAKRVK